MTNSNLSLKTGSYPHSVSVVNYKTALGVTIFTATVSAIYLAYNIGYVYAYNELDAINESSCLSCASASGIDFSQILKFWRINITAALLVSAVCLWSRKTPSMFTSTLAITWANVVYAWWYYSSLIYLQKVEVASYSEIDSNLSHIGGFRGATWWDMLILAISLNLFAWHLKVLLNVLTVARKKRFA